MRAEQVRRVGAWALALALVPILSVSVGSPTAEAPTVDAIPAGNVATPALAPPQLRPPDRHSISSSFAPALGAALAIGQPSFFARVTSVSAASIGYSSYGTGFDPQRDLWVADWTDNRVLEFRPPFSTGLNASLVVGQTDFFSSRPGSGTTGLSNPFGVAFDAAGNLWVPDYTNNRVLEYRPPFSTGMGATLVIGQPDFVSIASSGGPSGLSGPCGVAFDTAGNLWVADFLNSRVLEYRPPLTSGMAASLVLGQPNFVQTKQRIGISGMDFPITVAFDSSGELLVTDFANNRLLLFSPPFASGMNASLVIGQSGFASRATGVGPTALDGPNQAQFGPGGSVWVADSANNRVLEFQPPLEDGAVATFVLGQTNFQSNVSGADPSGFSYPTEVTFDGQTDLWVLDQLNGRVLEFLTENHAGRPGPLGLPGLFGDLFLGAIAVVGSTALAFVVHRIRSRKKRFPSVAPQTDSHIPAPTPPRKARSMILDLRTRVPLEVLRTEGSASGNSPVEALQQGPI